MIYKNLVTNFVRSWNFTRSETIEIMESLDDGKLQFKPQGSGWQSLYWEFGCIGRTQIIYTKAIETGKMDFSLFSSSSLPRKDEFQYRNDIKKFLEETDKNWVEAIRKRRFDEKFSIKWPGFNKPLINHITSLQEHERLHHGQFISYFTLAGFQLPLHFKNNWAL